MEQSDYRRFVIISPFRSGSTLLTERLNAHPSIHCYGELLNPTQLIWHPMAPENPSCGEAVRATDPGAFLEAVAWQLRPAQIRAAGFKLPEPQFHRAFQQVRQHLANVDDLHVIYLSRENLLARYVSQARALENKVWMVFDASGTPEGEPIKIDATDLENFFKTEALLPRAIKAALDGCASVDMTYEALITMPVDAQHQLCAFLGVDYHPPEDVSKKISTGSLPDQISNFDALAEHFTGTDWEIYFTRK
ncbi:MAG: sulfotransferase [Pseudomonadota bacterium]